MPRWITSAGLVTILISLAALGILLASNSAGTDSGKLQQDSAQVDEPDSPPQPSSDQDDTEGGLAEQEERSAQEKQPLQSEQTTQDGPSPGEEFRAPGPSTATIQLSGGAAYYCSLGVIGDPETIQGRRPISREVEISTGGTSLDTVMAACQKISPGNLGVRIRYDGEVVAQDETDKRLGTISVSWNPLEE